MNCFYVMKIRICFETYLSRENGLQKMTKRNSIELNESMLNALERREVSFKLN